MQDNRSSYRVLAEQPDGENPQVWRMHVEPVLTGDLKIWENRNVLHVFISGGNVKAQLGRAACHAVAGLIGRTASNVGIEIEMINDMPSASEQDWLCRKA